MKFEIEKSFLINNQRSWLITGVSGFIGSNLLEELLKHNQKIVGVDNFSNGNRLNLDEVRDAVSKEQWKNFKFIEGDIRDLNICKVACKNIDYVLHQAALGSVPRSIKNPLRSHESNVNGFLNMLIAARDAKVQNFVYAASSSTYGDHTSLPKIEEIIGKPLSPYAVTKYINELYADVFFKTYGLKSVGLRYFNVFGKRQSPNGAYAAVIPTWTLSMLQGKTIFINGDGETSRDFCYIKNVIQANILAALSNDFKSHEVFNIAVGERNSLNSLYSLIISSLKKVGISYEEDPTYRDFREGDVRHSEASISKAQSELGYHPEYTLKTGLNDWIDWYVHNLKKFNP